MQYSARHQNCIVHGPKLVRHHHAVLNLRFKVQEFTALHERNYFWFPFLGICERQQYNQRLFLSPVFTCDSEPPHKQELTTSDQKLAFQDASPLISWRSEAIGPHMQPSKPLTLQWYESKKNSCTDLHWFRLLLLFIGLPVLVQEPEFFPNLWASTCLNSFADTCKKSIRYPQNILGNQDVYTFCTQDTLGIRERHIRRAPYTYHARRETKSWLQEVHHRTEAKRCLPMWNWNVGNPKKTGKPI